MAERKTQSADASGSKTPLIQVSKEKQDLRKKELPLVDIKVTNPVTYIKSWWKKIIGNEGIDFRFRVRPLTAIAISVIAVSVSMGIGRFVIPFKIPFFEYSSQPLPTPTPDPWRPTAFSGILSYTGFTGNFYLLTSSSEAISLEVPENIDLFKLVGRRILATGSYHAEKRLLKVTDAMDLEILPQKIEAVPTLAATPTPFPTPILKPTLIPTIFLNDPASPSSYR